MLRLILLSLLLLSPPLYADPVAVCAVGNGSQAMIVYAKDNTTGVTLPIAYRTLVGIPSGTTQAYRIVLSPHSIQVTDTLDDARVWMESQP